MSVLTSAGKIVNGVFRVLVVILVVLSVYLFHQVDNQTNQLQHQAKIAAEKAIAANQRAALGRSKSLCNALYTLAETKAAVKLHPIFIQVYNDTDCQAVTGHVAR